MQIGKFHFDVVHGCQLRCVGCPNSTRKPKVKFATLETFSRCLKNVHVSKVGVFRLFNFGEPLLHPKLPELIEEIPKQKWKCKKVEISTNAQCLDKDMLKEIVKGKIVTEIDVSCDGDGTPEMYERLRPPAKWDKLIEFLDTVRVLKEQYNPKLSLQTRTIISKEKHKKQWEKVLNGWKPEFRGFILMPEGAENPFKKKLRVPKTLCRYMRKERLYVDYDGTVIPCCAHPRAFVMGNLLKNSYKEILRSDKRKKAVWKMKKKRKAMKICGKCGIS